MAIRETSGLGNEEQYLGVQSMLSIRLVMAHRTDSSFNGESDRRAVAIIMGFGLIGFTWERHLYVGNTARQLYTYLSLYIYPRFNTHEHIDIYIYICMISSNFANESHEIPWQILKLKTARFNARHNN